MKSTTANLYVFLALLPLMQLVRAAAMAAGQTVMPTLDECGKSFKEESSYRMIGGEEVELGEYPWMASIGYSVPGRKLQWMCGGSIISNQWILTAAPCLNPSVYQSRRPYQPNVVRVGDLDLNDDVVDGATPKDYEIEKVIFHEGYDLQNMTNDVGLIKTKDIIKFTSAIAPICLPTNDGKDLVGDDPYAAGWGRTSTNRGVKLNTELRAAQVEIQDLAECRANITSAGDHMRDVIIDERVICAASPGKDACQGDAGGPLMMFRRNEKTGSDTAFLIGITSYGVDCARPGYPGVYTRVSKHLDWIRQHMH